MSLLKFADLHLHTIFSDGTFTPQELVTRAFDAGLSCISITDHDTVDGLKQSIELGREKGVEVLPGIELSAEYDSQEVHILGYLINHESSELLKQLSRLKANRVERIYKIVDKLNNIGVNLSPQDVFNMSEGATPGRLHVARALLGRGFVKSIFEAFHRFIGDRDPAYVLGFRFSPQEAIEFIKNSGGVSVLAHPYILRNDELISEFIKLGLNGLEVYYPEHSVGETKFYLNLARENNLLITGGSDCHGKAKPEVRIGSLRIPYELVEKIKEAKGKYND